jgi:hypothetical protein
MRLLALSLLVLAVPSAAWAQVEPYNPYGPTIKDSIAVLPDGRLNWPSFYKSADTEAKFRSLFAQGICTGTRKVTTTMLMENKVDVNYLPEVSVSGMALKVQPGVVMMVDSQGIAVAVVTHPANVTKVQVEGTMPAAGISVGMLVRLQASVDETGKGNEPINMLEIVSGNPEATISPVEAGKLQTIVAPISRAKGKILQLKLPSGKLRRLTFELADHPTINVNANAIGVILPGAELKAKGHVYEGQGSLAQRTLFASEIDVAERYIDKAVAEKLLAEGKAALEKADKQP